MLRDRIILGLAGCLCCAGNIEAGALDQYEMKASKSGPYAPVPSAPYIASSPSGESSSLSEQDEALLGGIEVLLEALLGLLFFSDAESSGESSAISSVEEAGWADSKPEMAARLGRQIMPYVRGDIHYQYIDDTLDALLWRVEAGYKWGAISASETRYKERLPDGSRASLTFSQWYAMLRLGEPLSNTLGWEIGFGLGMAEQKGTDSYSDVAVTLPIKLQLNEYLGLEFRPAWYHWAETAIGDYDLSASLGMKYVDVRLGYHWLWMQGNGALLDGPYAGLSLSF